MADDPAKPRTTHKRTVRAPRGELPPEDAMGDEVRAWLATIHRTLTAVERPSSIERCACACRIEPPQGPTLDRPGLLDAEGIAFAETLPLSPDVALIVSLSLGQREDEVLALGQLQGGRYLRFQRVIRGSWQLAQALTPLSASFDAQPDSSFGEPPPAERLAAEPPVERADATGKPMDGTRHRA